MRDNVCYAGFAVRFFAWLVDMLVMLVPLTILRTLRFALSIYDPSGVLSRAVFFRYSLLDILLYLLPTVYFIAMTWSYGATLGKMLLKLEVVNAEHGKLTFWQTVIREIFGRYLSVTLLCIGYLMMIPDREKRALHDHLSDTRVIYAYGCRGQDAPPVQQKAPAPTVELTKPVETPVPVELTKPVEAPAPVELTKPVEAPAPVETAKPVEAPAPVETAKPVENTPTDEPSDAGENL